MDFSLKLQAKSNCIDFLKIRKGYDSKFHTLDEFIAMYPHIDSDELNNCVLQYKDELMLFKEQKNNVVLLSNNLTIPELYLPDIIFEQNIQIAAFFLQKAIDCLILARYFTLNSADKIDVNSNIAWSQGYWAQFYMRCVNFGTASTWYANCFDQIVQAIYWYYKLYTSVKDKKGRKFSNNWSVSKTMKCCEYTYVINILIKRNDDKLEPLKNNLSSCFSEIKEIREWANYIKHNGGIHYKHLEAELPVKIQYKKMCDSTNKVYEFSEFKSSKEVDIDEDLHKYTHTYNELYKLIIDLQYKCNT